MKTVYENPLVQLLSKLGDLILLQLAFLLTSIPMVTVGAGLTALFSVSRKMQRDSLTSPVKEYFVQFKANFKTGTILWLLILLMAAVTSADAWFCAMGTSAVAALGQIVSYLLMIGVFLIFVYAFPQAAWFENSISAYLKNALYLALANPLTTILLLVLYFVAFVAAEVIRPLFFLLGFSSAVYLASILLQKAFFPKEQKIQPEES